MHRTTDKFRERYRRLPSAVRAMADKAFALLQEDARHPSLHLKKVGKFWSARIDGGHRALAVEDEHGLLWVWIGSHDDYVRILKRR